MKMKNKEQEQLEKWVSAEKARLEKERKDFMEGKGYKDFFRPEKGTTEVVLLPKVPRAIKGDYGTRQAFRVAVGVQEFDWAVNPRSPVYRQLVGRLSEAPATFNLVRTGEGKSTRYDLVWK